MKTWRLNLCRWNRQNIQPKEEKFEQVKESSEQVKESSEQVYYIPRLQALQAYGMGSIVIEIGSSRKVKGEI